MADACGDITEPVCLQVTFSNASLIPLYPKAPSISTIPTLGPAICKQELLSPRVSRHAPGKVHKEVSAELAVSTKRGIRSFENPCPAQRVRIRQH